MQKIENITFSFRISEYSAREMATSLFGSSTTVLSPTLEKAFAKS
jgi:hypothetical protein